MRQALFWLFIFGVSLNLGVANAKVFRNAYVSFEMPDTWDCKLETTEWVCRSSNQKESREAIIILTAKEVGPTDSFAAYTQHLNTPQSVQNAGQASQSRVVYAPKQVKINDQVWIDGLQMGSEITSFFTRYLATIKDSIAVLVTFSAHQQAYSKYSQDFFKAVMSLRVIATKNLLNQPELGPLRPGGDTLGASIGNAMPADMVGEADQPDGGAGGQSKNTRMMLMGLAVLLAALAGYVLLKMKKK
jgi:hypothetical protein